MGLGQQILDKLTTRNILSLGTAATFLWMIYYTVTQNPALLENPLVTFILGTFGPIVTMIYVFYFRRNPSPPIEDEEE